MSRGDPFQLAGDGNGAAATGIVLVHGFTGTPYEVRYLGEQLARAGFAIAAPLLPGHGTSLDDLDRTTWHDWVAAVDAAYDALAARCGRVAVVGQSLGGLLALHLGTRRRDALAIGSLAAPLWLPPLAARVARWTQRGPLRRVRRLPKLGGSDVRDRRARAENPCYPAIPTRALGQLLAFMRIVDDALPLLAPTPSPTRGTAAVDRLAGEPASPDGDRRGGAAPPPVLVLHGAQDHTAPAACAPRIAARAGAARLRILPRSYHLIAADVERDIVAAEVAAFVARARRARPGLAPGAGA